MEAAVDPFQGDGPAKGDARTAMVLTSSTASERRIDSCQTMPLALALRRSAPGSGCLFSARGPPSEWPLRTALSQPARMGRPRVGAILDRQEPFALGRAADAAEVEAAFGQAQDCRGPEPCERLHHGLGCAADHGTSVHFKPRAIEDEVLDGARVRLLTHKAATRPPVECPMRVKEPGS